MSRSVSYSLAFEKALRLASVGHRDQVRKGSGVPYIEHPMAVALILDRSGFEEAVVVAGLLHDLVEDTEVTLGEVREGFGDEVAAIVAGCSETKLDAAGQKRPWIDRKLDHLAALAGASEAIKAVTLADKLHNLASIHLDLIEGRDVWATFNAARDRVLWYYGAMLDTCDSDDPRLVRLAEECRGLMSVVATIGP